MSDTGMSQEQLLMWLIANTAESPGDMKSMMSNIENPIYAAMVGGYDPLSQMQTGGGQLWNTYSQTQDPDMQTIVQMIDSGADEYAIQSAVDRMYAGESFAAKAGREPFESLGMSSDAIRSLIRDMQKERSLGSSVTDVFAKAGLSNPIDVYTPETVPLSSAAASQIQQYDQMLEMAAKNLQKANSMYSPEAMTLEERVKMRESDDGGFSFGDAAKGVGKRALMALVPVAGQVQSAKDIAGLAKGIGKRLFTPGGDDWKKRVNERKALIQRAAESMQADRQSRAESAIARGMAIKEVQEAQRKKDQFMKGYIDALTEQGRTPFLDQAQARLAMMQLLK